MCVRVAGVWARARRDVGKGVGKSSGRGKEGKGVLFIGLVVSFVLLLICRFLISQNTSLLRPFSEFSFSSLSSQGRFGKSFMFSARRDDVEIRQTCVIAFVIDPPARRAI